MIRLLSEQEKDYFSENSRPTDIKNLDVKELDDNMEEEMDGIEIA